MVSLTRLRAEAPGYYIDDYNWLCIYMHFLFKFDERDIFHGFSAGVNGFLCP